MLRLLRTNLLRRLPVFRNVQRPLNTIPKMPHLIDTTKLFLIMQSTFLIENNMQNFDLNLQQACDLGESAILDLMSLLKDRILEVCKDYTNCLQKQIEIIQEAIELGPMSIRWDDLPKYRLLAEELSQELITFTVILNAIGHMAHEESMKYITEHKDHMRLIAVKYKELQEALENETKEIKKIELKLLELNRQSILKS